MTISRRGFIAGLALTGAAVPAAFYAHREWTREEFPITPGEATVIWPTPPASNWPIPCAASGACAWKAATLASRACRCKAWSCCSTSPPVAEACAATWTPPRNLRAEGEPRYRVLGDLLTGEGALLYWRLIDRDSADGRPAYEFKMTLDEVWADFGNAGSGTLSGQILDLDRPLALTERDNRFIAHKQLFPEARQRIGHQPVPAGLADRPRTPPVPPAVARHARPMAQALRGKTRRPARHRLATRPTGPGARRPWQAQRSQRLGHRLLLHASAHARHRTRHAGLAVVARLPRTATGAGA